MVAGQKITVRVIGVDGSRWTISGPGAGREGVYLKDEHVGLIDTPVTTLWQSGANQIGASFGAAKFNARSISLPVFLMDSPARPWQSVESRWRKAWSYFSDSTIEVVSESGLRRMKCRLESTPEHSLGKGGQFMGATSVLMTLKAGDPLWYSEEQTESWRFDGVHWTGNVTVTNPTDMPTWLRWTITGPASVILPDFSFETREGWPGYEHQARKITMPFQPIGVDVAVDTDPMQEQVVGINQPSWWAKMNGQFFLYPVPPWTPPTQVPVAVNPLPWIPNLWSTLQVPFDIPTEFLVKLAELLTAVMSPLGTNTILSWTATDLAKAIDSQLDAAAQWARDKGIAGEWLSLALSALSKSNIAEIIAGAWGTAWGKNHNMAGSGLQLRQVRAWTKPYGGE